MVPVSQRKVKELYEICQSGSLSEAPSIIRAALEDPTDLRLDVAVVGEDGCDKSCLINTLQGESCGEPSMALVGGAQTPRKAGPYQLPTAPQSFLWDLAGWGAAGEDIWPLDLGRYDLFLLVAPEQCKDAHSRLARAIASEGKEIFLIRSKIEAKAQTDSQEELQEGVQASSLVVPQEDGAGCSPRVFLVPYDLPILQKALQRGAHGWKRQALRRAIPAVVSHLVRQKAQELMKDAWGEALRACLSCLDKPLATVVKNLLVAIASFRLELGLDETSLECTAQVVGKAASVLEAETHSLFIRPMAPNTLLGLITKPPSLGSWAWSYVPYFGWGAKSETQVSFEATYKTLQRAVVELSEDAERVLRRALVED
ncbi:interferon-inducible GTPase 5-like [Sceloporus undulatus]|uniref:interferon-inducible GTPase 5-like n=1 Tax=Sceloporus undulatus TaxID=8520 RepID=UPI001C4CAA74|nr:interferon-inducible GTPase 5-like [Sceloporus undulatus]